MKTVSRSKEFHSSYNKLISLLMIIIISSAFTSGCALLPVKDSVQDFTKGYLGMVLSESLEKSGEDFPGEGDQAETELKKYLENEFGKYFTESGLEKFETEGVFARRLEYFRENDTKKILNVIISVSLSEGSDEDEEKASYDYSIEYYAIDSKNGSHKVTESGVLEVIKERKGKYIIDSDTLNRE